MPHALGLTTPTWPRPRTTWCPGAEGAWRRGEEGKRLNSFHLAHLLGPAPPGLLLPEAGQVPGCRGLYKEILTRAHEKEFGSVSGEQGCRGSPSAGQLSHQHPRQTPRLGRPRARCLAGPGSHVCAHVSTRPHWHTASRGWIHAMPSLCTPVSSALSFYPFALLLPCSVGGLQPKCLPPLGSQRSPGS